MPRQKARSTATREARPHQFHLLLADDEKVRLEQLAAAYGLDASNLLRMLVKREHDTRVELPDAAPFTPRLRA